MNLCIFSGNLTRDPEVSYSAEGKMVTRLGMAIHDRREKETNFLNVVAFGFEQGKDGLAGFAAQYLKKGSRIMITGRMRQREWTDKDEKVHKDWQLIAENIEFGDSKKSEPES